MGEKLHDIGFCNEFLRMTPKAQATKEKADKRDFTKTKNFLTSKDAINRLRSKSK